MGKLQTQIFIPDIFLFTPIFFASKLIGFSATVVHHIDLGGGAPGLNPEASDVHQEGLIFPPTRYHLDHDWNGGPLERFIAANVRMPEATIGDLNAQFAANAIGAKRLCTLAEKFGTCQCAPSLARRNVSALTIHRPRSTAIRRRSVPLVC